MHRAAAAAPKLAPTVASALLTPCGSAVALRFGERQAADTFPLSWLWANAPAHQDASTNQHMLGAAARALPPALQSVGVEAGGLVVAWRGGARHAFPAAFLHRHRLSEEALRADLALSAPQPLPQTQAEVPAFAFDDLLRAGAPPASPPALALLGALNRGGIALVRGCPTEDPRAVVRLAQRLAPVMHTIYGESFEVSVQAQPINVAYTSGALALHQDLAYYESPPGLQLLLCREFSGGVQGGESTFACGLAAAEALRREDPQAFATLCRVPTTFQKVHYARAQPVHMVTARPIVALGRQWGGEGPVTAVFWAPPFEGPLRVPLADVAPYYAAYRAFAALLAQIEAGERPGLLQFRLAPGEAVVFNQRRVLHGRRAFAGQGVLRRVLQGCYVQADEWMSALRCAEGPEQSTAHARTGNQQLW